MENYEELVKELRKHGLSNGGALGHHSGLNDLAADAIEHLQSKEKALQEDIERLQLENKLLKADAKAMSVN